MRPKTEITLEHVLERAKRCPTYSAFQSRYYPLYVWARERELLAEIEKILPPVSYLERAKGAAATKAYTDEELVAHAKRFSTRAEWRAEGEQERKNGEYSHYGAAVHRGKEFMRVCCAHMPLGHRTRKRTYRWTEEALAEAASHYKHKGDWKRSDNPQHAAAYQSALSRPEIFERVTAHMALKANPYAGDYVVYAFEFTDRHAYVGITFRPDARLAEHMARGPVAEHVLVCGEYVHRHIERGLASPDDAAEKERAWIERYRSEGWTMLNTSNGGGLGTVKRKEWTKEIVIAEASKFTTRQAWIDGSQWSYRLAKREGWFAEAAAHMPRRVLGIGVGRTVSASTRAKQRAAKIGTVQSSATRQARSEALKKWWSTHRKPAGT